MNARRVLHRAIRQSGWLTQTVIGVPLYLGHTAWSGFTMRRVLGFGYTHFLFRYQRGFGEMNYDPRDGERLWRAVLRRSARKPKYLPGLRKRYQGILHSYRPLFRAIARGGLRTQSERELLATFRRCAEAQVDSGGLAHLIDGTSMHGEQEFLRLLVPHLSAKDDRTAIAMALTTPDTQTFLTRETEELLRIGKLSGSRKQRALEEHARRYFWLRNTYVGPQPATVAFFARGLRELQKHLTQPPRHARPRLPSLPARVVRIGRILAFLADWQDKRKMRILESITFLGKVTEEISRRTGVPIPVLGFLSVSDVRRFRSLADVRELAPELRQRSRGCLILQRASGEVIVNGAAFRALNRTYEAFIHTSGTSGREVAGTPANQGSARGRVVVCRTLRDIGRVRRGDVLVTSMTRPEFLPALRRAAAIVTDEGGITCHAAIVSRELDIPCIIGTKVATKFFKTGDRVEVDATRGIVRKVG